MPITPDQGMSERIAPGDAARILGVTTKTLAKMPTLHPIILPSGHRRYLRGEVEALLEPAGGAS